MYTTSSSLMSKRTHTKENQGLSKWVYKTSQQIMLTVDVHYQLLPDVGDEHVCALAVGASLRRRPQLAQQRGQLSLIHVGCVEVAGVWKGI